MNLENSQISFPEASSAAQAAADYVNNHGGVLNHPIVIKVCKLLLTPESDTACANQFASQQPVAVIGGGVDAPSLIVPTLTKAKVSWVTANPSDPIEYNNPYSFGVTGGSVATTASFALYAKDQGYKAFSFVGNQNPAASGLLSAVGTPIFAANQITFNQIFFPPTALDLTSYMTQAARGDAGGIVIESATPYCISGVKAAQQLGIKQPIVISSACQTPSFFSGAGAAWTSNGLITGSFGEKAGDPDTDLYTAAMAKYAPGSITNGFATEGFAGVMDFVAALRAGHPNSITATTVQSALAAAKDVPSFLTLGSSFTCGGSLLPKYTSLCGAEAFYYKQSANGAVTPVTQYNTAAALNGIK